MHNIVLTGMMGSGKSSVAKELAKCLPEFNLVELDDEIEKCENLKISEIFEQKGEEYFRTQETLLLKKYAKNENQIISLGGGAFIKDENRQVLKDDFTVYLSAASETIFSRIKNDNSRPLLKNNVSITKIQEIINKRESFYKLAKYEIKTDNKTTEQIAKEITEKYEKIKRKN